MGSTQMTRSYSQQRGEKKVSYYPLRYTSKSGVTVTSFQMCSGPPVDFPHSWSMTATTLVSKRLGEHVTRKNKTESDRGKGRLFFVVVVFARTKKKISSSMSYIIFFFCLVPFQIFWFATRNTAHIITQDELTGDSSVTPVFFSRL